MTKYVYFFGAGKAEGSSLMRNLLGGKGGELAEMTNLGIPGPPGFTITTQAGPRSDPPGGASDPEGTRAGLRKTPQPLKDIVSARTGAPFPQDPREQLRLAIDAVFDSWFAKKATEYRRIPGIPADWGTAVTVMAMVFGNLGETSGTGVGFTRDPRTGDRHFYAEFLAHAQGEDVVAGIRTPEHIDDRS